MKSTRIVLACYLSMAVLTLLPLAQATAQPPPIVTRIDNTIERSIGCFASLPDMFSDELWFLLRAQQHLESLRLGKVLERFRARSRRDGMAALIDPSVSEMLPPPVGPKPWQELILLMRASLRGTHALPRLHAGEYDRRNLSNAHFQLGRVCTGALSDSPGQDRGFSFSPGDRSLICLAAELSQHDRY